MPSSTAQTQLGRQFWASIRETVDAALWNLPSSQKRLNHIGFGQARFWGSRPSIGRFFTSSRHLSSQSAKFSSTNVRRSCTSGGLLLLGLGNPTSSTQNVVTTCAAAADSAITAGAATKTSVSRSARQAWQRNLHTGALGKGRTPARRYKSSKAGEDEVKKSAMPPKKENAQKPTTSPKSQPEHHDHESITESMSKYLSDHLPHLPRMPHRPTKEELLAAATGFWQRMKVRFKWFSIRSMRPWNADEWGAFVSWFVFGHIVWILVGTTTFFSLVILTVNTVFAQEELAKWVGDYLTQSAGVTVVFESAIVPKWKDGVITFRNVFVSRRPGQLKSSVKKGSSTSAAAMAAAKAGHSELATEADDGNYTQFDVTINTVNVTLSFIKWWNGKGFLKDVEVKGVRGVVDRTHVVWPDEPADPLSYRHEHQPGDFEIEHFKLEDLLVTIHQPDNFRPFSMSIYSCELPQLRKQWLFYDFLSATHMSGSFDGSLFTIHPRQIHGVPAGDDHGIIAVDQVGDASAWKKFSRLRIDGLKIDHLNRGVEGPFGWIYEGNLDIVADIMFPADVDEGIGKVVSDFYDKMEEAVTSNRYLRILDNQGPEGPATDAQYALDSGLEQQGHLSRDTASTLHNEPQDTTIQTPATSTTITTTREQTAAEALSALPEATPHASPIDEIPRYLVMDLRLHLNDVRAQVPYFSASKDLGHSYINAALIRPIVAYINSKRTYIPINCRVVKRASDFDGSWSIFDCGLMDDMSAEVYSAFARDVEDQQSRVRRLKKVGFWTLSMVVHALLAGVAGDYM